MKRTILVVDDCPMHQELVARILKRAGFEVLLACDGEEGRQVLEKSEVNLAILDWNMPRMNGGNLAKWIRRSAKYRRLPILMLTVRDKPAQEAQGFSSGADDYLYKSYTPTELLARVERLLSLSEPGAA